MCDSGYRDLYTRGTIMARIIVVLATVALAGVGLAACGDDSGGSNAIVPADTTSADTTSADSTSSVSDGGDTSEDDSASGGGTGSEDADGASGDVQDLIDDLDFGDGLARVTIGDMAYEFTLGGNESADGITYIGVCQEIFGLLDGGGYVSGDPQTGIDFTIPPPDWESFTDGRFDNSAPRIEIELGDSGGWAADLSLVENFPAAAGQSQIDEWTLEGSVASGTATFIEMEPFSAPVAGSSGVKGSFEIGCDAS
nr:hypothetical protein [uncultured bacterium]